MIKALILENEQPSANALKTLLNEYCAEIEVLAICNTLQQAVTAIKKHEPNIVFLDIELNNESGLDLLGLIPNPTFEIIFTTAFDKYTLDAIRMSCLDYLLKPIDKLELLKAINKFKMRKMVYSYDKKLDALLFNLHNPIVDRKICIPTVDGYTFIKKESISVCIADSNYTFIHTANGEKIVCSKSIGTIEELINEATFYRCHKSYLINLNQVKKYDRKNGNQLLMFGEMEAPVSARKREELLNRLGVKDVV